MKRKSCILMEKSFRDSEIGVDIEEDTSTRADLSISSPPSLHAQTCHKFGRARTVRVHGQAYNVQNRTLVKVHTRSDDGWNGTPTWRLEPTINELKGRKAWGVPRNKFTHIPNWEMSEEMTSPLQSSRAKFESEKELETYTSEHLPVVA